MRFGIKSHYALLALLDVVNHGRQRPIRLAEIAERQRLPLAYLEQLFNQLKNKGIVESVRGQKGGYLLAQDPQQTVISEVLGAIDEPIQVTRCNTSTVLGCQGEQEQCGVHYLWEEIEKQIHTYLSTVTLADIYAHKQRFKENLSS